MWFLIRYFTYDKAFDEIHARVFRRGTVKDTLHQRRREYVFCANELHQR